MQERIDALQKMKAKIEKDKQTIRTETKDARAATEEVIRSQASVDKANEALVEQLKAINKKADAADLTLGDFTMAKNKIANEIKDIMDQITEGGRSIHEIDKIRKRL